MAPSLAESWTVSPDQRVYEFKLREGLKFHNGDPFTAEDVKFSFERYKWPQYHRDKFQVVEIVDPYRVRIHSGAVAHFMTFYGTMTRVRAGLSQRNILKKWGMRAFASIPSAWPYKFVSYTPGIELVMEAVEGTGVCPTSSGWSSKPSRTHDASGHAEEGEVDVAYDLEGELGEEIKRDPKLRVAFSGDRHHRAGFPRGWDPKSPGTISGLAASYAIDRQAISDGDAGGLHPTGSLIPREFEFALPSSPTRTIRSRRNSSWPRPAIPMASMGGTGPKSPLFRPGGMVANDHGSGDQGEAAHDGAGRICSAQHKQLRGLCTCGSGRYGNACHDVSRKWQ